MRKVVVLVALLVAFASPAAAQGVLFGAKVGVNFASLSFDPEDEEVETSMRTGFTAGVLLVVPANARIAFQPEVLFSQQGSKVEDPENAANEGSIKLNYVNVPLLANIRLGGGDNPVSLLVGPQIGFRTSAKAEANGEEEDLKEFTEGTDFGLVTGLSAMFRNVVVDARYIWGLSNINADETDDQKVKNRVFTISVGVVFR